MVVGGVLVKNSAEENYEILKVFNNNVLLVKQAGIEKVLYERGLGFGKHTGQFINCQTPIEKVFSIEDKNNSQNFLQLTSNVDNSLIALCEEIIYMISNELHEELNEKIHISLIDHISFTVKRLETDNEIQNPFLVETETLYKREFQLASKAVHMLEKNLNIVIPEGEIGFIALHIHSARNEGRLSNTIKYAFLSNSIVELLEDELNISVDRQSLDYARFLTHLRFAIERIISNNPIKNELLYSIKRKFKKSYEIAKKAAKIIENELFVKVVDDEIGYIAIYIERFKSMK